jgi:hypothetical protein
MSKKAPRRYAPWDPLEQQASCLAGADMSAAPKIRDAKRAFLFPNGGRSDANW